MSKTGGDKLEDRERQEGRERGRRYVRPESERDVGKREDESCRVRAVGRESDTHNQQVRSEIAT